MTHEYDEEIQKVQGVHPPSTAAGASSKATTPANPAQLPTWAQGSRSPLEPGDHLTPNPKFVSQMMKEEGRAVRRWLDEHTGELRALSLSLSALVQRVLDNVPEAAKLARIQIETIICEWEADAKIIKSRSHQSERGTPKP